MVGAPTELQIPAFSVKDERSHLKQGGFFCFTDTPMGKAPGVGTGPGGGVVRGGILSYSCSAQTETPTNSLAALLERLSPEL